VASGGDFCGSVCASAVAAASRPKREKHVRYRIRHERREHRCCPTRSNQRHARTKCLQALLL